MKIAENSALPIIIYNVPGRTASNVSPETILKLARADEKFVAVKDASGNFDQIHQLLKNRPKDFAVLSGDDPTALATIALGGEGVISVISNAFPREFSDMIRAALNGDYATARRLNLELYDVHKWLYKDGNPAGIKAVLNLLGFCENELNLPLIPASKETIGKLEKEVKKMAQFSIGA